MRKRITEGCCELIAPQVQKVVLLSPGVFFFFFQLSPRLAKDSDVFSTFTMRPCCMIVAATGSGGIGKDGKLPWELPADMAYFREVTTRVKGVGAKNAVIMGRKTWASIPAKFRPLKDRLNIVLSKGEEASVRASEGIPPEVLLAGSLGSALALLAGEGSPGVETVFVIGGASAFAEVLSGASGIVCDTIYLTRVLADVPCDVGIPPIDDALYALDEMQARPSLCCGVVSASLSLSPRAENAHNPSFCNPTFTHPLSFLFTLRCSPDRSRMGCPFSLQCTAAATGMAWPGAWHPSRGAPALQCMRRCSTSMPLGTSLPLAW